MNAGIQDALERVYAVFSVYPLRDVIEGCPCCVSASDQAKLRSAPLRQLGSSDLGKYSGKAMTTWGEETDFKHFFPRLLELAVTEGRPDLWDVIVKVNSSGWGSWSASERDALEEVLRQCWTLSLLEPDQGWGIYKLIEHFANLHMSLTPQLEQWRALETPEGLRLLADEILFHSSEVALNGALRLDADPTVAHQYQDWLFSQATLDQLEAGLLHPALEAEEDFFSAIDTLTLHLGWAS